MNIVEFLKRMVARQEPEATTETELIYVRLPLALDPTDREAHFADALEAELRIAGLGWVSGGGSLLGEELPDGSRPVEYCGIDVDAVNVTAARELLRQHLPELGCPAGTQLYYREDGQPLQDEYDGRIWTLAQPRTEMHPGFGM